MRRQEELRVVKRQAPPLVPVCGSQLPATLPPGPPPQAMALLDQRRTDGMKHQKLIEVNNIYITCIDKTFAHIPCLILFNNVLCHDMVQLR